MLYSTSFAIQAGDASEACHRNKTAFLLDAIGQHRKVLVSFAGQDSFSSLARKNLCRQKGIQDPDYVVNVSFRQLLLKYSDYSGKLSFFDRIGCNAQAASNADVSAAIHLFQLSKRRSSTEIGMQPFRST